MSGDERSRILLGQRSRHQSGFAVFFLEVVFRIAREALRFSGAEPLVENPACVAALDDPYGQVSVQEVAGLQTAAEDP